MISIWWAIPLLAVGAFIGVIFVALCGINESIDKKKKWWEE